MTAAAAFCALAYQASHRPHTHPTHPQDEGYCTQYMEQGTHVCLKGTVLQDVPKAIFSTSRLV